MGNVGKGKDFTVGAIESLMGATNLTCGVTTTLAQQQMQLSQALAGACLP